MDSTMVHVRSHLVVVEMAAWHRRLFLLRKEPLAPPQKRLPVASWDPQNGAAGGAGRRSGYALSPSGPTGQASCRRPAKLIVAAQAIAARVSSGRAGPAASPPC